MATEIVTSNASTKPVKLHHPINGCPAMAQPQGYYHQAGRAVGLVLLFPDGHTASLTFAEIRNLQTAPDP